MYSQHIELIFVGAVFLVVTGAAMALFLLVTRPDSRAVARLRTLSEDSADKSATPWVSRLSHSVLPALGQPLKPQGAKQLHDLQNRLEHAGLYHPAALALFLGARVLFIIVPALLAGIAILVGLVSAREGLLGGAIGSMIGMIGPGFWLGYLKARRQNYLRRALPDALDVIIICVEGGLSLPGALRRVTSEVRAAHPVLAQELMIVEQEIFLGSTVSQALRQFGKRCDLEGVRSLATQVRQSEELGTSIVKALNIYSDSFREQRQQQAEEKAQKAATKIVFPTLLFIFPVLFVVLVGPATVQLLQLLGVIK